MIAYCSQYISVMNGCRFPDKRTEVGSRSSISDEPGRDSGSLSSRSILLSYNLSGFCIIAKYKTEEYAAEKYLKRLVQIFCSHAIQCRNIFVLKVTITDSQTSTKARWYGS